MHEAAPRPDRRFLAATLAVQAAAAAWAAHGHRDVLNPDGVAYVLNAGHWARGEWGLAVNGYWGPLFSWLLAPLVAAGTEPVLAAHLVAAFTSLVFTWGAHEWLRATVPSRGVVRLATVLAAATAVMWAADTVTPDLLVGGLLAAFAARVQSRAAWDAPRAAFAAGLWLGAAYLAKAVAVPFGALFVAALAVVARWSECRGTRPVLRTCALVAAGWVVVALPWLAALSAHYGRPTWSTTGPIAHAVVGPGDRDRSYPTFRTFHAPEPGRITSWEDPTPLPYDSWSPLASTAHLRHQVRVAGNNAYRITGYLKDADWLGLGVACAALGLLLGAASRRAWADERWRLSGVAVACLVAPYLAVYAYAERYFWAAHPFLLAASFGLLLRATPETSAAVRRAAVAVVAASFALGLGSFHVYWFPYSTPVRPSLLTALAGRTAPSIVASREAAEAVRAAGLPGPVHSDVREGLFVAFFAGVPSHGEEASPSPERLDEAGARLVVTRAGSPLEAALSARPGWRRIDGRPGAPLAVLAR